MTCFRKNIPPVWLFQSRLACRKLVGIFRRPLATTSSDIIETMQASDDSLSPEVTLLKRLAAGELSLLTAIRLFSRVDLAKKAVETCVRAQAIEVWSKQDGGEAVVQPWRLRGLLNDPGTWEGDNEAANSYQLRLTELAQQRCRQDFDGLIQEVQVVEQFSR